MSSPEAVTMWVVESGPAYHEGHVRGCAPEPFPDHTLPKGVRGQVTPAREECGSEWSFIRVDVPGHQTPRLPGFYVETRRLSTTPPAPGWDKAKATGSAWVVAYGDRGAQAIPLDDPKWLTPMLVPVGEAVELLAVDVIRTPAGHEAWIDPFFLSAEDPLAGRVYGGSDRSKPLRRRLLAGLPRAEKDAPLTTVPAASELAKRPVGSAYFLTVRPSWIVEDHFSPEWFDPVGQTLDHACTKTPVVGEPCGRYELDYSALGAWLPTADTDVIGVWTGKALAVQVLSPWSDRIAVSPSWDPPAK